MELKSGRRLRGEELCVLSEEALNQNDIKSCDIEMRNNGVENIIKLGNAFSGKKIKIMARGKI